MIPVLGVWYSTRDILNNRRFWREYEEIAEMPGVYKRKLPVKRVDVEVPRTDQLANRAL